MIKFLIICVVIWCLMHWWIIPLMCSVKRSSENKALKRELGRAYRALDKRDDNY